MGIGSVPQSIISAWRCSAPLPPRRFPAIWGAGRNPISIYRVTDSARFASSRDRPWMGSVSSGVCLGRQGRGDEYAPFRPCEDDSEGDSVGGKGGPSPIQFPISLSSMAPIPGFAPMFSIVDIACRVSIFLFIYLFYFL